MIAETASSGAILASYACDASGRLFSMRRGGDTHFYRLDARGDVVALAGSSGAVVNAHTSDPWGAPLSAAESVPNPYRYASYRYDEATGLYWCWNRCYAPELARFLTRDIYPGELSDPVSMNPYLYCGADPVNNVDPSGMAFWQTLDRWWMTQNERLTNAVVRGRTAIATALDHLFTIGPSTPLEGLDAIEAVDAVSQPYRCRAKEVRAAAEQKLQDAESSYEVDEANLAAAYANRETFALAGAVGGEMLDAVARNDWIPRLPLMELFTR